MMASFVVTLADGEQLTVVDIDAYAAGEYVSGVCQSPVTTVRRTNEDAPVYGAVDFTQGEE